MKGSRKSEHTNAYVHNMKRRWSKAFESKEGQDLVSQYDQVIDFVVTDEGGLVDRFQVEALKGMMMFRELERIKTQPLEQLFVVTFEPVCFFRLFDGNTDFISLWFENKIRCLPAIKKDYLIGWTARMFEFSKLRS